MDIVEFLRARLDEDEAVARAAAEDAGEPDWDVAETWVGPDEGGGWETVVGPALIRLGGQPAALHIMRYDPARVLREVEAKRRIVEEHEPLEEYYESITFCGACGGNPTRVGSYPCYTIRLLALPHSDHPDYQPEWKP